MLSTDQISLSSLLSFLTTFNWRITKTLEFNFINNNNNDGEIITQKQFSLAYLEELEITLSLLNRIIEGYNSLKKIDKDKIEFWNNILGQQTMRIFNSNTDIIYAFPPITEHEQRISIKTITETTSSQRQFSEPPKQKRSIFDPVPRTPSENKIRQTTQVSIFSYRIQTMLGFVLENILSIFIYSFQIVRALPSIDINNFIGASRFALAGYTGIANNTNFYANLDRNAIEEFRNPDVTSMTGGVSQRYENNLAVFMKNCKKNFEMLFYLVIKFDLNKNLELKIICQSLLTDWIKIADVETFKGEPKDPYLAYILDQIGP